MQRSGRFLNFLFTHSIYAVVLTCTGALGQNTPQPVAAAQIKPEAAAQIKELEDEKATRTAGQLKIDSQLIYAIKMDRNEAITPKFAALAIDVPKSENNKVEVEIRGTIDNALLARVKDLNGDIKASSPESGTLRVQTPLSSLEKIAVLPEVKSIRKPPRAVTNANLLAALDREGDTAHGASVARRAHVLNSDKIKIGVISDSIDNKFNDLAKAKKIRAIDGSKLTILPNQGGPDGDSKGGSAEGLAMLEIVNTIVPGAQLYFATGFTDEGGMAANIRSLRKVGCDVIIDDLSYFDEPPFQDGIIARAVNEVVANGVLYFSSAANSGNKTDNTSGTWEGDFSDGGPADTSLGGAATKGRVHSFALGQNFDRLTKVGSEIDLFWSDPAVIPNVGGGSSNDYDLFLLNADGSKVEAASTNAQTGTQDPYESISTEDRDGSMINASGNDRIVIVKAAGAQDRFLYLDTERGRLAIGTDGNTKGHNAAESGFCVAASDAHVPFNGSRVFDRTDKIEDFSSDGFRRVFFDPTGKPFTPGNFSSTGGKLLKKPDFTAADGVSTSCNPETYLNPFFGTSAAAPHAGAIAGLLKSINSSLTSAQIADALRNTAVDIMDPGYDRDSGVGVLRADLAAGKITNAQKNQTEVGCDHRALDTETLKRELYSSASAVAP